MPSFPAFIQVYNTAVRQQVRFEELRFRDLDELKAYKQKLKDEYGAIGCHTVKVFIEILPEPEEDEFDEDELEDITEEE